MPSVGSKSSTSAAAVVSLACLRDSEIRRRSRSMSIMSMTSSLTWTTCSAISTWRNVRQALDALLDADDEPKGTSW